jgi:Ice-binding-like/Bacterial Ig-like domain (group 3)
VNSPVSIRTARLPLLLAVVLAGAVVFAGGPAAAQQAPVGLGTADNFAVLAGQGVTNTGPTTVNGDLGTWPNPAVTGAGLTVNGSIHAGDAVAQQAQADTTIAYNDAAGRTPVTTVATELGGQTLTEGAYNSAAGTFQITGTLTLDAEGDPNAVFIFQAGSTLITASNSTVNLINGANACNVFWQVGSSATLGTNSTFRGTILALASITVTTGVTIQGRALARNGAVTLDSDTITRATCATPETTGTTVTSSANPSDSGQPVTFTATVTGSGGGTPTGSVTFFDNGTPIGTVPLDGNGQATLTTSSLTPGSHTITAEYLGAPGFENSSSPPLIQQVNAGGPGGGGPGGGGPGGGGPGGGGPGGGGPGGGGPGEGGPGGGGPGGGGPGEGGPGEGGPGGGGPGGGGPGAAVPVAAVPGFTG